MADLVVIVPSRGRPAAAAAFLEAHAAADGKADVVFAVDWTDPVRDEYWRAVGAEHVVHTHSSTMVEALNMAAAQTLEFEPDTFALAFAGDDHRPRTAGWSERYLEALRELGTGMVYGDDLLQGERLPTQIAMTADIIRALGFMAPPSLVHLAVDNWWLELGRTTGCIRYLPDVVVEHMHPVAGKAEWDDGHRRVNAPEMYHADLTTMARLRVLELPGAVGKVKALRGAR